MPDNEAPATPSIAQAPADMPQTQRDQMHDLYSRYYPKETVEAAGYRRSAAVSTPAPNAALEQKLPDMTLQQANVELRMQMSAMQEAGSRPSEYRIKIPYEVASQMKPEKAAQLVGFFQMGLHGGEFPKSQTQMIVREALASAAAYKAALDKETFAAKEDAVFRGLSGNKQAEFQFALQKLPETFRNSAVKQGMFVSASARVALAAAGNLIVRRTLK